MVLVDEDAGVERVVLLRPHPGEQRLEPLGEHEVIVVAPRVARDADRVRRASRAVAACARAAPGPSVL